MLFGLPGLCSWVPSTMPPGRVDLQNQYHLDGPQVEMGSWPSPQFGLNVFPFRLIVGLVGRI